MSSLPNLLSQCYPYQYRQIIQSHVLTLLSKLPSLQPKIQLYTHDTVGKQVKLLVLEGTVPMYYRRMRYNIPVRIWLTEGYPQYPPLVYVVPTQDMELKTNHKHMDHTGRCYLPYLSEWKIQTHNLYDLCNYLGTLFGEDPPVFAKQKRPAAGPAPQNSATTVPSPHSSSSSTKSNATPPPPQHSMHHSYHGGGSTGYAPQQHFAHHQNPMAHSHQFSRHPQQHAQNSYSQQPDYQTMQRQVLEGTRRTVVQKVQSKLSQFRQEQQGKIQQTLKDQREQQARLSFQESESKRLDQQFNLADQNMEKLSTDIQKLQKFINEEQSRGDLSVEDIIEFTDALSQQDMELTAEDSALEDCLYNLERALQRDLINTEEFLRTVRKLARKQFETRALKEKVRKRKMES